jgi:metal-responsive CopG/Arc/MetJ family transcriptional regulator
VRKKDIKQLVVEVPVDLAEELEKYCAKHSKFKGGVVREAIETLLEHERDSTSRFIVTLPETTSDDLAVFRAVRDEPTRDGVVRSAIREYIDHVLEVEPHTSVRFRAEKQKVQATRARSNVRAINGNKSR